MKVVRLTECVEPPLAIEDHVSRPAPGRGGLLIRVHAAGVTSAELSWHPTSHGKSGEHRTGAVPGVAAAQHYSNAFAQICHVVVKGDLMEYSAEDRLIGRAFLTAHLLTGNTEQAESATMTAIDSWNPEEESEEALFQDVLDTAVRAPVQFRPEAAGPYLSAELRAVLRLAPQLRRCFVLRILVRLPSQVCARLLSLPSDAVDRYTCAALWCLGALDPSLAAGVQSAA